MSNTQKQCSRDDCLPANVNISTTTKCFQCQQTVHLPCIGISLKVAEITSPNIRIICNKCVNEKTSEKSDAASASELNVSFSAKSTPKTVTIKSIMHEVNLLKSVIEANGKKLDAIDDKTELICKRTESTNLPMNVNASKPINTQARFSASATNRLNQVDKPAPSFANVLCQNMPTPKRKRVNTPTFSKKLNAPAPKVGTKTTASGLSVVVQPKRTPKPTFSKSIWVSRLGPSTTEEEIADYICENTPIVDRAKFSVHKLVKKDRDLSTLKFVSFKVAVNDDEFDILIDPDVWPENLLVRRFHEETTLGDFFPSLNAKKNRENSTENMETSDTQPPKVSPSKSHLSNSPAQ